MRATRHVPCKTCPLRQQRLFKPFSEQELRFVATLKTAHVTVPANQPILELGAQSGALYTLFSGWAFRYLRLPDGSRQILDFLLPGDLIGLQPAFLGGINYGVTALTAVSLCVLHGAAIDALFDGHPGLVRALVATLLEEKRRTDRRLAVLGRRQGPQRIGYLMLETFDRLVQQGLDAGTECPFPLRRRHLADALGLSGSHVNRSLDELQARGLATIEDRRLLIRDRERLAAFAGYTGLNELMGRLIL
jgi:CRP-like cAMP-binding protein